MVSLYYLKKVRLKLLDTLRAAEPSDLHQTSMTMQPMRTAMEVDITMADWRFSMSIKLNSAATDS
ncbi:unnamed protein product [Brassica napus]|uniref:(rape) hypothetical protein n=1 Tax=Brassica napus TaxID=3708 RepID=A0A817A6H5_BRANA|nr:unnamed protein product [Brassica napus]